MTLDKKVILDVRKIMLIIITVNILLYLSYDILALYRSRAAQLHTSVRRDATRRPQALRDFT